MAEYQITYWQEIPSMVMAREGRRNRFKIELPARFQVAIDEAAMRANMIGTDAYLEQWHKSDWENREGTPQEVVETVVSEIETAFSPARIREILNSFNQ